MLHGMQKVRGSNPLSSTDLSDVRSILKTLTKTLTGLGLFVAFVCVAFVVVEDAVHHRRSAADLRHDHVAEAPGLGVVHLGGAGGGVCLEGQEDLAVHARVFEQLRAFALSPAQSARLLRGQTAI
jgi:hypothetical protein